MSTVQVRVSVKDRTTGGRSEQHGFLHSVGEQPGAESSVDGLNHRAEMSTHQQGGERRHVKVRPELRHALRETGG